MTIGLMGRKRGMTRVFTDAGESIPVTVIEALPNRVTQVKSAETDGYRSVQVAFGSRKPSRLGKPLAGHYGKAKVEPGEALDGYGDGLLHLRADDAAGQRVLGADGFCDRLGGLVGGGLLVHHLVPLVSAARASSACTVFTRAMLRRALPNWSGFAA